MNITDTVKSIKANINIQKQNPPTSQAWQSASDNLSVLYKDMASFADKGLIPEGKTIQEIIGA